MRSIVVSLLLAGITVVSIAFADPRVVTFTGGPRVLLEPDSLAGAVAVNVWYEGGFRADPPATPGLAYVLSQTALVLPPAVRSPLEVQGGTFGAVVNADYVSITSRVPAELFETTLDAQLQRIASHPLSEAQLAYGIAAAGDAVRGRNSSPIVPLYERLYASAFRGGPYAVPAAGTVEGLGGIDLAGARRHLERQFAPTHAWMTIVGRFDPADAMRLLRKQFGEPAAARQPDKPPAGITMPEGLTRLDATSPISVPVVMLGWRGPADRDADSPAFEVLGRYLAEGQGSLLARTLVGGDSKVLQIQGSFDRRRDASILVVAAAIAAPGDSAAAEHHVIEAVERWASEPLPSEDLLRAKRRLESVMLQQAESAQGRSDALATAQLLSGSWSGWRKRIDRVRAVTAADVQRAAAATLTDSRRTMLWARPAPDAQGGAR